MLPFLGAVAFAAGAIFVAEFGDKSQLLILAFATRHAAVPVIAGIVVAAAVVQGLSVVVGATLGAVLPETLIGVVAGIAFLGVAAWTLRGEDDEEEEGEVASAARQRSGVALAAVVAATFVAGELGDKTMLATLAIAAQQDPIATWIGASAGMVAANLVAVVVGRQVGQRLSPRAIRIGSSALFALAGILVIVTAVIGE
ncbi:MAG TPA: TMEM165/GDT1 family protein [Candidatus Limnocylindria bacterium]|nr:TMEM165/GDT1 family protein [Candidatus Limnocylindria bacterium]